MKGGWWSAPPAPFSSPDASLTNAQATFEGNLTIVFDSPIIVTGNPSLWVSTPLGGAPVGVLRTYSNTVVLDYGGNSGPGETLHIVTDTHVQSAGGGIIVPTTFAIPVD